MIYLATPYTHDDQRVVQQRFEQTEAITAHLLKQQKHIVSPIVHCHALASKHAMPTHFQFWQDYCLTLLDAATELWVVTMPGWDKSTGVQAEIAHAQKRGIQIQYINTGKCQRCHGFTVCTESKWCDQCHYPGIDNDWDEYQALLADGYRSAEAKLMSGWEGAETYLERGEA